MSEGLEALKRIEIQFNQLGIKYGESGCHIREDDYFDIEKELKALEIIKEKPQATMWLIQHYEKEMKYEELPDLFKEDIVKEQFDLLKEVLL